MRILLQECLEASLRIGGKVISSIGRGEVIFVGYTQGDNVETNDKMLQKLLKLRVFGDENGKTNLSLDSFDGEILCVSQFTLYADLRKGNRPSFTSALPGKDSEPLYNDFKKKLSLAHPKTQYGVFGADMKVSLINDGPFTLWLDSKELF